MKRKRERASRPEAAGAAASAAEPAPASEDGQDQDRSAPPPPPSQVADPAPFAPAHDEATLDEQDRKRSKSAPVLPWMRLPIEFEEGAGTPLANIGGLDPRIQAALIAGGYKELFPVQCAAWEVLAGGNSLAHDLCLCAPTGSGKTLAYALPLVQGLAGRRVACLRALVVLPTRELAVQVHGVIAPLAAATGLRTGLAAASASLQSEAADLVQGPEAGAAGFGAASWGALAPVDILVATPGRLMAHLRGTPGITLRQLRYLVVDETDRLLRQAYQDWLPQVIAALEGTPSDLGLSCDITPDPSGSGLEHLAGPSPSEPLEGPLWEDGAALERGQWAEDMGARPGLAPGPGAAQRRVVKVVVSATLTRDPAKLERLALHCPRYLALATADHRYAVPKGLREFKVVCNAALKPLTAAALVVELAAEPLLVFAASLEATHRLSLLLSSIPALAGKVAEFSSSQSPEARRIALGALRGGAVRVLVASDALARGMDVPGVAAVVSYDAPPFPKTYVHRAGRTARAGRAGRVFTILRPEEVRHFKALLHKVDNAYVKDYHPPKALIQELRPICSAALRRLPELLEAEA